MKTREGDRLVADHETLRAILEVRPEGCIHVALFNMEPQSPVQLAAGDAALEDDFAKAKDMAISFIAGTLGLRDPKQLAGIRENIAWRLPEGEAKPPVRPCEERLQLEKELLVAMHNHLMREEATKAAAPSEITKAKHDEDRAKEGRDLARRALQQHQSEHGC